MHNIFKILILTLIAGSLISCEDEFDLTAPYEDITVVYGMIDKDRDTTWLKINKAFLGDGNVLEMARIEDSSRYKKDLAVTVTAYNESNNEMGTYSFDAATIDNKEDGIFYNPYQQVYYSVFEPNEDYRYDLLIKVGDKEVRSTTPVVRAFSITSPSAGSKFINVRYNTSPSVEWNSARNGTRYEVVIRLNFRELWEGNPDTLNRHVDWFLGTKKAANDNGGIEMSAIYLGDAFYRWVEEQVPYKDPQLEAQVRNRFTRDLEFIIYAAADELNTYMEVNEPSSSIIQEKPEYTNIENGYGLFSSRLRNSRPKNIHPETIQEIKTLPTDLKFVY